MPKMTTRRYVSSPVGAPPKASSKMVSRSMRSNKGSGTIPELRLAELLDKRPAHSTLPGRPDFVFRDARLAVFLHGCWWHGCPEHYKPPKTHTAFWRKKLDRNQERDTLNRQDLESMGWRVVEVWEHELERDPNKVVAEIRRLHDLGRLGSLHQRRKTREA